jgi:plasmid stabilization system protein ParE
VARVELTAAAVEDLDRLVVTHSLPGDTRTRVRSSLEPLRGFPHLGPELTGPWSGMRFILGPWRWMVIVYEYRGGAEDEVVVLTIQDARTSRAATSG